jgi:hypothetical protein
MKFIFEDLENLENFIDCEDINKSGMRRFSTSPIVNIILNKTVDNERYSWKKRISKYIIPTGVNHHPKEWAGRPIEFISLKHESLRFVAVYDPEDFRIIKVGPISALENEPNKVWIDNFLAETLIKGIINLGTLEVDIENMVIKQKNVKYDFAVRLSIFSYLNKKYLDDLKSKKAMLLIDQSLEGYQIEWLWEYFHNECKNYKISPNAIIYVTGNLIAEELYDTWCEEKTISEKINVIPYTHFEHDVKFMSEKIELNLTVDQHLDYKKKNFEKIKTYNCMMKRLRAHRCWWYTYLYRNDLLDDGLVSMNSFNRRHTCFDGRFLTHEIVKKSNELLPLEIYGKSNVEQPDNFYIRRIIPEVHLDTWVSVVSEASFSDEENTIFLSEKLFKPIVCMHPFIVVGNRGSLKKLRDMGYKTFEGFIDESYDDLPTIERFDAIIETIKKVRKIENKLAWYESMKDILEHNYKVLEKNAVQLNPACQKIYQINDSYFKETKNV